MQPSSTPDAPPVRALLYTATPDNPNFSPAALADLRSSAHTIATARGPSGPNIDYLRQLAAWLAQVGEADAHVERLLELLPDSALGDGQ